MGDIWREALLDCLMQTGELGQETATYIRERNVRFSFRKYSKSIGARWFPFQNIALNSYYYSPDSDLNDAKLLSLVVHEVHHLKQGMRTALSVYGELDAWQVEYRFQKTIQGGRFNATVEVLLSLPLNFDRANLKRAVELMQVHAGKGYHVSWLPLRPLGYLFFR